MLSQDTPFGRSVSRTFKCIDCGSVASTGPRGSLPLRCNSCKKTARKRQYREHYYRRTGRAPPQTAPGAIGNCAACGASIRKSRADRVYCDQCLRDRLNAYNREVREQARRAAGVPIRSGVEANCVRCGETFMKASHNHKYCRSCRNAPTMRYIRERIKTDPQFALNFHMSAAIRKSLARRKNGYSWERLVGYAASDLMAHLERQFLRGMSWGNRGEWHIDHVVPLSSFHFTGPDDPEFRAAWSLTNLRPIWAADNLRKRSKRLFLL